MIACVSSGGKGESVGVCARRCEFTQCAHVFLISVKELQCVLLTMQGLTCGNVVAIERIGEEGSVWPFPYMIILPMCGEALQFIYPSNSSY